jgi:hypothetical protein
MGHKYYTLQRFTNELKPTVGVQYYFLKNYSKEHRTANDLQNQENTVTILIKRYIKKVSCCHNNITQLILTLCDKGGVSTTQMPHKKNYKTTVKD